MIDGAKILSYRINWSNTNDLEHSESNGQTIGSCVKNGDIRGNETHFSWIS